MSQRDREFNWGGDRRERQERESDFGGRDRGRSEFEAQGNVGRGPSEHDRGRQGAGGRENRENYGREGRGGEAMRHDIEDNWRGRGGRSEASDYDYGYGRSGVAGRDYDREYGYGGGQEYYGGGGLFGGGMGGYTGGGYRGGGLGSNYEGSSGYSDYPRESGRERGSGSGRGGQQNEGWWGRMTDEVSSWFGGNEEGRGESRRGRGPRGYTRSDDRIREDINDRLTDHHAIDASDIEVEVNGGEVALSGTVDSRYEKRLAEDIVESVSGVNHVENRIRVNRGGTSANTMGTESNRSATETTTGTSGSTVTGDRGKSAGTS